MAAIFAFRCSSCSEIHEGSPSFGYDSPLYYAQLSDAEKQSIATLSADFCTISQGNATDYFVRAVLEIPIEGVSDPFLWGVWVSLSEKNFNHYRETLKDPDESHCYFGWFSNRLPYYPDTLNLKTSVHPRKGLRPFLELDPEQRHHPLVDDFYNQLSIAKAQEIVERITHRR